MPVSKTVHRSRGVTAINQNVSDRQMCFGEIGRYGDAALQLGKSPVVLPTPKESNSYDEVRLRFFFVHLNRPLRDLQAGLGESARRGRPNHSCNHSRG